MLPNSARLAACIQNERALAAHRQTHAGRDRWPRLRAEVSEGRRTPAFRYDVTYRARRSNFAPIGAMQMAELHGAIAGGGVTR